MLCFDNSNIVILNNKYIHHYLQGLATVFRNLYTLQRDHFIPTSSLSFPPLAQVVFLVNKITYRRDKKSCIGD